MLCNNFVFAGSVPSLGMGLLFGSLIGLGAYQTSNNPNNYYVALGTSVALAGFMGKRFLDSGKIMPAGLIAAVRYYTYCQRCKSHFHCLN